MRYRVLQATQARSALPNRARILLAIFGGVLLWQGIGEADDSFSDFCLSCTGRYGPLGWELLYISSNALALASPSSLSVGFADDT